MSTPSNSISSNAVRETMPPYRRRANPRRATIAAPDPRLHQRDNPPHQSAAAPAQNSDSTFLRIYPMNPEPTAARMQNPESTFSRINLAASQPPAACFMTHMPVPSRQTCGFTRLPWPSTVLRQLRKCLTGALATAPHPPYFPRIHERGTHP